MWLKLGGSGDPSAPSFPGDACFKLGRERRITAMIACRDPAIAHTPIVATFAETGN